MKMDQNGVHVKNPWERVDRYGEFGMAPQPLTENLRLALLALIVVPIKLIGSMACLLSFYVVTKLSFLLPVSVKNDWVAALGRVHCRACLFFIGFVRVRWITMDDVSGADTMNMNTKKKAKRKQQPIAGIVSNHCSWCDILVHMSRFFPSFVARDSTETTPIIGSISKSMGCIYVERARTKDQVTSNGVSAKVKERMERIHQGNKYNERPILLFPEGTTTNGRYLLPFKTGAFIAGVPLQPVVLKYQTKGVSPAWESIPAIRHIILMLCNPFHSVICYQLPIYNPSPEEQKDPALYAANIREYMLTASGLLPSDLTFLDKVKFVGALRKKYST